MVIAIGITNLPSLVIAFPVRSPSFYIYDSFLFYFLPIIEEHEINAYDDKWYA